MSPISIRMRTVPYSGSYLSLHIDDLITKHLSITSDDEQRRQTTEVGHDGTDERMV
jgi:hypothetical protein